MNCIKTCEVIFLHSILNNKRAFDSPFIFNRFISRTSIAIINITQYSMVRWQQVSQTGCGKSDAALTLSSPCFTHLMLPQCKTCNLLYHDTDTII